MAQLLKYGSRGNQVKTVQEMLNTAGGYNLTADGIYGDNTLQAVKDYQQKNGLDVDGIVGDKTLKELLNNNNNNASSTTSKYTPTKAPTLSPTPTAPTYDTSKWDESGKGDAASDAYEAAKKALGEHGEFVFSENEWLNSLKDSIKNYGDFSYDVNSDALYQQYADQYMRQGKLASADVMGQAAAMTGGYGNSYAASVGNQAYLSYLQQLNDKVPELYQLALDRYNMGKQDLYDQYGMLLSEYEREYGLHSDEYNKLLDALGIAREDYYSGADMFYTEQGNKNNVLGQQFTDEMAIWDANNTNDWNQAEWEESANRYANEEAWRQKEYDLNNRQVTLQENAAKNSNKTYTSSGSSSSGGSGSGSGSGSSGKGNSSGNGSGTGSTSGVTDAIRTKASGFTSNTKLADYIDGLISAGTITDAEGDALYAEYVDNNEKYNEETGAISYKDMVGSTNGWTVVDDGGANLWGVDKDAIVKAPNGETITLAQLRDKLKSEGMTHKEATDVIKQLQQNLGISSNWMFGW